MEILRTKLSDRLSMVASLVDNCNTIADIGTDHAYLPAYLVTRGICRNALACDIGEGPLKNAEKIIRNAHLKDYIKTRLSDGLDNLSSDDADIFIFAGMGGTLITRIISKHEWIKDEKKTFIFQPMSHSEDLISFLISNGFEIEKENCCFDDKRCYIAFKTKYTGNVKEYPKCFPYIGLLKYESDEEKFYIDKQYKHLEKRYNAIVKNELYPDEQNELKEILDEISKIKE